MSFKPKILFFADFPNWAFHHIYRSVSLRLGGDFDFDIYFSSLSKKKIFSKKLQQQYDIVWIAYPADKNYLQLKYKPKIIIKEVASWRWQDRYLSTNEFFKQELADADVVACPSLSLLTYLSQVGNNVVYIPNGVESWFFKSKKRKPKPIEDLIFGWVGNSNDPEKNFEIIKKLQNEGLNIQIAQNLNLFQLRNFYTRIDILLITSRRESQPLTLLESISAGCYVISENVGIVPEIVENNSIGYISTEWTKESIFKICKNRVKKTDSNIHILEKNDWSSMIINISELFKNPRQETINALKSRHIERNSNINKDTFFLKLKFILSVYLDLLIYGKRFN